MMKGRANEVLYIGKAKDLRSRVRSYFRNPASADDLRYAVRFLASKTAEIDHIVTANEKEALLLEDTLIKKHRPRYNLSLKDSKTYVSIKITVNERFPRISVVRAVSKDGARYFGPYVSSNEVRGVVKLLRRIFLLCACTSAVFRNRVRPCLDHQLGLCSAPATGLIGEAAYAELVKGAIMFLEGRNRELLRALKLKMRSASKALDFEEAARQRDRISAIESMLERQAVVSHAGVDRDVFALARDGSIVIQALFIRGGRLVNSASYLFKDALPRDEETLSSFMRQFYDRDRYVPAEVLIPFKMDDALLLEERLCEKAGKKVRLSAPARGERLTLVKMAEENALQALKKNGPSQDKGVPCLHAITGLQKRLHLKNPPDVIEAFDISNIGSSVAVGAMVTFRQGVPDKGRYRLYKIRDSSGPDDYAMLREVLLRRYAKDKAPLPDLILIDGGKGQLNIAMDVLDRLGILGKADVAALAKEGRNERGPVKTRKGERVYLPNLKDPIFLKEGERPDLLLRRIRDEVHRFAISYARRVKTKADFASPLDDVPAIGEKKKKALYDRFKSVDAMINAPIEELKSIPGMTEKLARAIKFFHNPG